VATLLNAVPESVPSGLPVSDFYVTSEMLAAPQPVPSSTPTPSVTSTTTITAPATTATPSGEAQEATPAPTTTTTELAPAPDRPRHGATIHVVKPGEWVWGIARTYGVDPEAIIAANHLTHPGMIYPGQRLVIP
jgi:LysM repeat protein